MSTKKELRATQQKAREICQAINVRDYCLKVYFLVYSLTNPSDDGDCYSHESLVLGDAITYLIEMQEFFKMPVIDQTFARQLYIARRKTMTVTNKKTKERFKLRLKTERIDCFHWEYFKENRLYKTDELSL